jgi:uncharacterized protein involved in outer membrane biogenesis
VRTFFRETLTGLALGAIVVLSAAALIPPLVSWESYRSRIDAYLSQALKQPVRTQGAVSLRLLPSPRVALAELKIQELPTGETDSQAPYITLKGVLVELSLLPLLKKELTFTSLKVDYADLTLTRDSQGNINALKSFSLEAPPSTNSWTIGFESLQVLEGRVRINTLSDGENTQQSQKSIEITPFTLTAQAHTLAGPWRIHGAVKNIPFDVASGLWEEEKGLPLKGVAGGSLLPRFEFEGRWSHSLQGKIKIQAGPPAQPSDMLWAIPTTLTADVVPAPSNDFTTLVAIRNIQLEAGEGASALRAGGEGTVYLLKGQPHLALNLEATRLDMDAFWLSPAGTVFEQMLSRKPTESASTETPSTPPLPATALFEVKAKQIWAAGEPLEQANVALAFEEGVLTLKHLDAALPGGGSITFKGEGTGGERLRINGHLALVSDKPAKVASWLKPFHVPTAFLDLAGTRSLEIQADVNARPNRFWVPRFSWQAGEARLDGTLERLTQRDDLENTPLSTLKANIKASRFDVSSLPTFPSLSQGFSGHELFLDLSADNIRFGSVLEPLTTGTLEAKLHTTLKGIDIQALKIKGLGTLNADLSGHLNYGQVSYGQEGRITGQVKAAHIAPLMVIVAKITDSEKALDWVPSAVNEAPLEGTLTLTTRPPSAEVSSEWNASNGSMPVPTPLDIVFEGTSNALEMKGQTLIMVSEGVKPFQFTSGTFSLNALNGIDLSSLRPFFPSVAKKSEWQKAVLNVRVEKNTAQVAQLSLDANLIGETLHTHVKTLKPIPLHIGLKPEEAGQLHWRMVQATPTDVAAQPYIDVKAKTGFEASHIWFEPKGDIFSSAVEGNVGFDPKDRVYWGEIKTQHLSLSAFALPFGLGRMEGEFAHGDLGGNRFQERVQWPASGDLVVYAEHMSVSPQLMGKSARVTFSLSPEQLVLKDIKARVEKTDVSGTLTLKHLNGRGSVAGNLELTDAQNLLPALHEIMKGRTRSTLNIGAAGETLSAMLANLNGSGQLTWEAPVLSRLSPLTPFEAAKWALSSPELSALKRDETSARMSQLFNAQPFVHTDSASKTMIMTLSGGVLKAGPVALEDKSAKMTGQLTYDLKQGFLIARADVQASRSPVGWIGQPPLASMMWRGTSLETKREVDASAIHSLATNARLKRNGQGEQWGQNGGKTLAPRPPLPPERDVEPE